VDEAWNLRKGLAVPRLDDGPTALHEQLLAARRALDRVEELVVVASRAVTVAHGQWMVRQDALQEAEDRIMSNQNVGRQLGDFSTGRERMALVASKTGVQRVEARRAERTYEVLKSALEQLRIIHRGVNSVRYDCDTRLRLMTFERSLER
jgi:hypothetical protein